MKMGIYRLLLGIAVVGWGGSALSTDPSMDPVTVLRRAGLVEVNQSWVCRDEARLLRQLDQLDQLRSEFLRTRRIWRDLGEKQARLRSQLEESDAKIQQLDKEISLAIADAFRKQVLEERQRTLRQQMAFQRQDLYKRLDGLNERSEFSQAARKHVYARTKLEAARIALHIAAQQSGSWYNSMDAAVVQAVASLSAGENQQVPLGPIRDYPKILPKQLARVDSLLADTSVPIYRADGQFHVPAVLNEVACATWIVSDDTPLSLAPSSLLEAAGVTIPSQAPRRTIRIDGQRIEGCVVQVISVRIGLLAFGPVDFLALDPEVDGLGPLLNVSEMDPYQCHWNYEHLELEVRPR
ncbi:MAG: hypothetical protein JW829_18760 [Pirellulales bacterium]|nr:hypothetical protein [Pirellulales bacterium]